MTPCEAMRPISKVPFHRKRPEHRLAPEASVEEACLRRSRLESFRSAVNAYKSYGDYLIIKK